jgi:DNA-binding transcriptional ArsR family regulator
MRNEDAVQALAALGQGTRLEAFKLLIKVGPDGMLASDIASALAVPRNTMSSHLNILSRAALIVAQRSGKNITYSASLPELGRLTAFLVDGCCGERRELCEPIISKIEKLTF